MSCANEDKEPVGGLAFENLTYVIDDGICTITLNRPDALNAFTVPMAHELVSAFHHADQDDDVRAVIVTGAGRAFCAGMDLRREGNVFGLDETQRPTVADMHDRLDAPDIRDGVRDSGGRVSLAIHECRKPVIAAINGPAVGVGATMTCAMDFRLVSTKARIGFVFATIGIVPEACSTWFLPRIVGLEKALELCYTAQILSAEEAHGIGLVRSVHEPAELLISARELADRCTKGRSPVGVALTRSMLRSHQALDHPLEAHRAESLAMFYTSIGDGKEGVAAFLGKRAPIFDSRVSSDLPDIGD